MFSTKFVTEEKLWYGPDIEPLYNPQISIAQVLLDSMSIFGSKVAQISDNSGIQLTFDEMKSRTIRAAQNLQALGYKPKDVFTIIARNSHHVAPITYASIAIGCPVNILDPSFTRCEVIHMIQIAKPVLIFCDVTSFELVNDCLMELGNGAKIFTIGGSVGRSESIENLFKETFKENEFIPVKVDGPNETAIILCSSGTTGLPKGVCISHAAILYSMSRFVLNSNDVMLCFSSLYWVSGVITMLRGTFIGATRIITTEIFSPELQIRLIEKYKVTFTLNAPHHMVLMMKCERFSEADFSSLKFILVGGSRIPSYIKSGMNCRLPNGYVHTSYGMSETFGPISLDCPAIEGKDAVGRLQGCCCIKIIDNHGNRCDINEEGEICIKTAYKFLGYYGNPQATADLFDEEGFLLSGDVGYFDEDGDLFVTERKKDLLKYCNFGIAPSEIDAYLTESPDIQSACVVGIDDETRGDLPAAVIVRAEGSAIREQDVFDMVAGNVMWFVHKLCKDKDKEGEN